MAKPKVAFLIESEFEDSEFQIPFKALKQAGALVTVLGSRMNDEYTGKRGKVSIRPDATATEVRSEDFDAIVIPGGAAPDKIRTNPNAVRLILDAMGQDKLIAAVCHGPQVLIEADALRDRQATGFAAIRKDITNAGAHYVDEAVVVDGNLITSRCPADLAMFTMTLLNRLELPLGAAESSATHDLWQVAEAWGGSTKADIVAALNTALTGERYTLSAFEKYDEKISDPEAKLAVREAAISKRQHVTLLEERLEALDEKASWQAIGGEMLATLQTFLQSSNDLEILRQALGDIQTGMVDAKRLAKQLTDPTTAELMLQIQQNLERHEEHLSTVYRSRAGANVQAPKPTTIAITA